MQIQHPAGSAMRHTAQTSLVVRLISAQRELDDAMMRGDPDDLIETQVALVADLQQQVALVRVAGRKDDQ